MEEKEKEELIEHWMNIINAVFCAEEKLNPEWAPKLQEARKLSTQEIEEVAQNYLRALAVEILTRGGKL